MTENHQKIENTLTYPVRKADIVKNALHCLHQTAAPNPEMKPNFFILFLSTVRRLTMPPSVDASVGEKLRKPELWEEMCKGHRCPPRLGKDGVGEKTFCALRLQFRGPDRIRKRVREVELEAKANIFQTCVNKF